MIVSGRAKVAAVVGWPVVHSRSPLIHGHWLETYAIDGAYVPLAVRPEHFTAAFRALPKLGLTGANITAPHKEAALRDADAVDPIARRIGAANTAIVEGDRIRVTNTDASGFLASLTEGAPAWRPSDGSALVIGAGGAARAVVAALIDAGAPAVLVANRTDARAAGLVRDFGRPARALAWNERTGAVGQARLLVNASSAGLRGGAGLDLVLDRIEPETIVVDLVYDPLATPLLQGARTRGCTTVDGLGMLLHQARASFKAWFGVEPAITDLLRQRVIADIERGRG
jgi:shikimate dehydrogenase